MASLTDDTLSRCGSLVERRRLPLHKGIIVKVKLSKQTLDIFRLRKASGTGISELCQSNSNQGLDDVGGANGSHRQISDGIIFSEAVDPILAACFLSSLRRSNNFLDYCLTTFSYICQHRMHSKKDFTTLTTYVKVIIPIMPSTRLSLEADIRWSDRILSLWMNRLIIEDVFSWFSTLGGAYSSLGDYHNSCAIQAGFLSVKQLKLAWTLGDPFLQSRCLIYLSQSLMQRGYFKLARTIIRKQYQFAVSAKLHDHRLVAMCEGVWTRLLYTQWTQKVGKGKDIPFKMVKLSQVCNERGEVHTNGHISRSELTN